MSDLGTATGRIRIDTSGVRSAQNEVKQASAQMGDSLRQIGAAAGVAFSVQAIARFVVEADNVAVAYGRQLIAAKNLAGSQAQLNDLLGIYQQATGGAVDKATALANVTQLMSVGFADSTEELDKFATAIRGISVATGRSQDTITQNLILELFSQRGARLDQLGLQYETVKARADALAASDRNLTKEMAYQQAVLEQAIERYGALTKSAEGQATGLENLRRAWKDFRLEFGKQTGGATGFLGDALANWLADNTKAMQAFGDVTLFVAQAIGLADRRLDSWGGALPGQSGISDRTRGNTAPATTAAAVVAGAKEAKMDWQRGVNDINAKLRDDIISAETSYGQQRADTIRNFQKDVAREERDFQRNRLRANIDFLDSVADVYKGQARREAKAGTDLARAQGKARADSAERLADMQADLDRTNAEKRAKSAEQVAGWEEDQGKAIAENRKQSVDNLLKLEEDYAKARLRAQTDHRDTILGAAARLDAYAIATAQKAYARQQADADAARQEQLDGEKDGLTEAITQLNAAHKKRVDDEAKALDGSIAQANAAHARAVADEKGALDKQLAQTQEAHALQLEEGRANDAERLTEMKADFARRKAREDEDRAIRKGDQARDYADQLAEMAAAHGLRMGQLREQALREREQHQLAHEAVMVLLGAADEAMKARVLAREKVLTDSYDRYWDHVEKRTNDFMLKLLETTPRPIGGGPVEGYAKGGPVASTGLALLHAGEYVIPAAQASMMGGSSMTNSTSMGGVTFNIYAQPGQGPQDIVAAIDAYMQQVAGPYRP